MKKFILISLAFINMITYTQNKIIYLISTPRSMSVAFMRMIQQRGDFTIFHEPSQCAFNSITWPDLAKQIYKANAPKTFNEVKQNIFKESLKKQVFAKEMVFAVKDFIMKDASFVTNPNIYFVFLLRSPHPTVISYCKNSIKIPNDLADRVGCKAMYELLNFVNNKSYRKPLFVLTEDLYNNPIKVVNDFCKYVEIPFKEDAMHWQDLGMDFDGAKEWNEYKHKELVQRWHGDAIHSTGFARPANYEVDNDGNPTFIEVKKPEWLTLIKKAYEENRAYYKLLIDLIKNQVTK